MKPLAVLYALCLSVTPVLAAPAGAPAPLAQSATVRAGVVLDVQVASEPTLTKQYTVDAAGRITVDMIGSVMAAGRTPDQVAAELRTRLKEYVKEPEVTVTAMAPAHQDVLVTGEVTHQGPVPLRPGDGIIEALAGVGGLAPDADAAHATLIRRGQSQPQSINLEQLLKGDLSQNMILNDGDVIQVPKLTVPTFMVRGEVKLPGLKQYTGSLHVMDAILGTGGLTDRADHSRITLQHKDQSQPIVIDLDRVLAGETSANVPIQAGDVLTVAALMGVQVVGEVHTAGVRLLRNGGTLMEAILGAGGFGPDADRTAIEITHKDGTTEKASLAGMTSIVGGPILRPGDIVLVKSGSPQFITLFGAFRNAQAMRYQEGMKITDVLMSAGLQENAKWKEIRVLRGDDGPSRKILTFNLEAYLKSPQTENLALQPGDRVVVQAGQASPSVFQRFLQLMPLANLFFLVHP